MSAREDERQGYVRVSLGPLTTLLGLVLAVSAPGCGEEEPGEQPTTVSGPAEQSAPTTTAAGPTRLTGQERRLVRLYDERIQAHCIRVTRSLLKPNVAPSARQEDRGFGAADALLALAATKPTAPLGAGQDLRLFVSDVVENLQGSNCDPRMTSRLEQGLASLAPG